MWSKCRALRASPRRTPVRARLERRLARACLMLTPYLAAAGLLPGSSCAWADQSISVQLLPAPGSAPGAPSDSPFAVPGKQNQLGFLLTCSAYPSTSMCDGGHLIANFGASQGQRVIRAWTDRGATCVTNDSYLSCPIEPAGNTEQQQVHFILDVAAWDYADSSGTAVGADGLALPPTDFTFPMKGEGSLEVEPPKTVIIPETSAIAFLGFRNKGPSMNREVTFRLGPFPLYINPEMLSLGVPCLLNPDRILECGPITEAPGAEEFLMLRLEAQPPFPPMPNFSVIKVLGNSDLQQNVEVEFMATIVPPRPPTR